MSSDDFGNRPFVAGSLTGLRAFRVTPSGHLTGIFVAGYRVVPGVNVAFCAAPPMQQLMNAMSTAMRGQMADADLREVKHELLGLSCRCGFYAYFDGGNDFLVAGPADTDPRVAAVVEGFGKCVVGDRGFRAEKLRLVALIRPEPVTEPRRGQLASDLDAVGKWLSHHLVGRIAVQVGGSLLFALALFVASSNPWVLFPAAIASGGAWGAALSRLTLRGWRLRVDERMRAAFGVPTRPEVDWAQLLANYPDVPVYGSAEAALAAHPLTVPDKPEGEADAPFVPDWVRRAGFGFVTYPVVPPQRANPDDPGTKP